MAKVQQVSEHVNLILKYIPYVQTNFVVGLDVDEGPEPFELTKKFVEMTPGAFPAYSLLTAFGEAAPLNLQYQKEDRVLGFPFHFMNNNQVMNVKPKNYQITEFLDYLIDLTSFSFSWRMIYRRFRAIKPRIPKWMNVLRAVSSEGFGRIRYHTMLRALLDTDRHVRRYWEGETDEIPRFYLEWIKRDLGPLWPWLPEGAMYHDPKAYLKREQAEKAEAQKMVPSR